MSALSYVLDLLGVAVFAATGGLVAARKGMDATGFLLVGTLTGIGGGTLRDLLLARPVFWITQNEYLVVCLLVSGGVFLAAPHIHRRRAALLWADAVGLSVFAAIGARIALDSGSSPLVAVVMGVMTATFGGVARDIVCNEVPLILRKEVYATAAAVGACVLVVLDSLGLDAPLPGVAGALACLVVRGLGIRFGLSLPAYGGGARAP